MDGFNGTEGITVIAATNQEDHLDEALLRPGRFDRKIKIELPDGASRLEILKIHIAKRNTIIQDDQLIGLTREVRDSQEQKLRTSSTKHLLFPLKE